MRWEHRFSEWSRVGSCTMAVLAVVLLILVAFTECSPGKTFFTDDLSTSIAVGQEALKGNPPWIGPPSHHGGRHLGPWYYVNVAGGLFLTEDFYSANILWSLLKIGSLIALAFLASRMAPKGMGAWAFSIAILCAATTKYIFVVRNGWHAHFFLIPAVLTVIAFYGALRAPFRRLPWFLVAASLCIQTHYMGIVLVVGCSIPLISALFDERRTSFVRPQWSTWLVPVAVCTLSWVPLIAYESVYGGAVLQIVQGQLHHQAPFVESLTDSSRTLLEFLKMFSLSEFPLSRITRSVYVPMGLWILVFGLVALWFKAVLRASRQDQLFWMGLLLSSLAAVTMLARVEAPRHHYYLYGLLPIPILGMTTALIEALRTIRESRAIYAALSLFVTAGVFSVWAYSANQIVWNYRHTPFARWHTLAHAESLSKTIVSDRALRSDASPLHIIGRGETRVSTNNYYLFASGANPRMKYSEFFREIPAFQKIREHSDTSYLVVCPTPPEHHRIAMWKEVHESWPNARRIDLTSVPYTKNCELYQLSR